MRIVSLVPSLTETLAALGLDEAVVGLTRFCVHPPDWRTRKAIVGGTKAVRVDRVRALAPDLVVANREENTRADVEAVATFAPVVVTDIATVDGALAAIRDLGHRTGCGEAADALAARLAAAFAAPPDGSPAAPALRVAYLIWRDPWMVAGGDTFISDVLARCGLANVFADRPRYPAVTPADLAAARPDALLLSSEPYPFDERHVAELGALVPGVPAVRVDGEAFSWYGPRMAGAPTEAARLRAALGT